MVTNGFVTLSCYSWFRLIRDSHSSLIAPQLLGFVSIETQIFVAMFARLSARSRAVCIVELILYWKESVLNTIWLIKKVLSIKNYHYQKENILSDEIVSMNLFLYFWVGRLFFER